MNSSYELLADRDAFTFVESVKKYLDWRIAAHRQRFISWRNQPEEVGNLSHALWLINQAWSGNYTEQAKTLLRIEREQNIAACQRHFRRVDNPIASLPPKKPVARAELSAMRRTA